jgi:hypothetical protein
MVSGMSMESSKSGPGEFSESAGRPPFIPYQPIMTHETQSEITAPANEDLSADYLNGAGDVPADTVEAGETPKAHAPEFGVRRFEGTEPHFEGDPPDEYITAVCGVKDYPVAPWKNIDIYRRLSFFVNCAEVVTQYDNDITVRQTEEIPLQYSALEGNAHIVLRSQSMTAQFTGPDSQEPSVRYHNQLRYDEAGEPYGLIHKGTPLTEAPFAPGLSNRDMDVQREEYNEQQFWRDDYKFRAGNQDPLVGVAEMQYMVHEVLPNAKPMVKTYEDVIDAIRHSAGYDRPSALGTDNDFSVENPYGNSETAALFDRVVAVHHSAHLTPEHIIYGSDAVTAHPEAADTRTTTIRNELVGGMGPEDPRRAQLTINHSEEVDGSACAQALARRGGMRPGIGERGTFIDEIHMVNEDDVVRCAYRSTFVDPSGKRTALLNHEFTPHRRVVETLRNFMLTIDDVPEAIGPY